MKSNYIGEALLHAKILSMRTKVIPREVGKVITNSRELREFREVVRITDNQKQIVIGAILGDGCLIPNAWGKNYRLQIEQSAKQRDYCFWKYEALKNFVKTKPQFQERNKSWKFRTISHPVFTMLATQWYDKNRHKQLPDEGMKWISPLVLAIWYMDDGGLRVEREKIYGAFLNTQGFSWSDNKLLRECLKQSYGIETLLLLNHRRPRIYIPHRSLPILRNIIKPHIHSSMCYKLP